MLGIPDLTNLMYPHGVLAVVRMSNTAMDESFSVFWSSIPINHQMLFQLEYSISPPGEQENIREGYLTCKVAVVDGKKANDRSWKTVYAVLKCKALYMFKDKKMALDNLEYEEKPVKLVESEVEVASDYTKRKNVFRVKTDAGSEYLFQVLSGR